MKKIVLVASFVVLLIATVSVTTASSAPSALYAPKTPTVKGIPTQCFILSPYIDKLWLSFNPDGTINGYDEVEGVPCYPAPILGLASKTKWILFTDFKTAEGCYELGMIIINYPNLDGTAYLTSNGWDVYGPISVQLVPCTAELQTGKPIASAKEQKQITPTYRCFTLAPYIDELHLDSFAKGMINGEDVVEGSVCYPAPIFGGYSNKKIVFVMDYKTNPSCYELGMAIIDRPALTGILWRTTDGIDMIGPTDVSLVPCPG